jgi:hypothetical protein
MYSRIEMYSFADFYHRFSTVGLTLDEIFENWQKYSKEPRDINDPVRLPERLKKQVVKIKPPATKLQSVLKQTCAINNVQKSAVNGKSRKRQLVEIRQWVAYVGIEIGFEPPDFERILGWERSGIYHKKNKAAQLAKYNVNYRNSLNEVLSLFGCDTIIA